MTPKRYELQGFNTMGLEGIKNCNNKGSHKNNTFVNVSKDLFLWFFPAKIIYANDVRDYE